MVKMPFCLRNTFDKRYYHAAEVKRLSVGVQHNFHLTAVEQDFMAGYGYHLRGKLCLPIAHRCKLIYLCRVYKRFVALDIDHVIILAARLHQRLITAVGATCM